MNNLWLPSASLGFLDLVELVQALSPLAMHALKIIPGNSDREAANDPTILLTGFLKVYLLCIKTVRKKKSFECH